MALSCWLVALLLLSLDPGSWGQNDRVALRYGVLAAPTTTVQQQPSVTASAAATAAAPPDITPIVPKAQVPLVAVLPPGHTCLTMCINHQTSTLTKTITTVTVSPSVSTTVSTTVSTLTVCPTTLPTLPTTTTTTITTTTTVPVTNSTTVAILTPTQQIESSFTLLDIGPPPAPSPPVVVSSVHKSMSTPCEDDTQ